MARRELHVRELFAVTARERAEQGKRSGHHFRDQVFYDLDDHAPHRELGIVERALNRQIEVDHSVAVLQERNREQDGKLGRRRAVDMLPKVNWSRTIRFVAVSLRSSIL